MGAPICIIGTGYVGMACMIGLAELGWPVRGYDILRERIEKLRQGFAPYEEAGIRDLLGKHISSGRLSFFDSIEAAACDAEVIIITVGTPAREDGSADLTWLINAIRDLAKVNFSTWPTVCVRSTVPPGTSDTLAEFLRGRGELIYSPEFLSEGSAVRDFLHPDRIVVGCASASAAVPYVELLEKLQKPVIFTSRCNAELVKCCSNAFLALKVSFANEVANLCDALGATADDVLRGVGYDHRIGPDFLRPGIGFGGPCFEKDVKSIQHVARLLGTRHELFSATLDVNAMQPKRVIDILRSELGQLHGRTIGTWGLAFKAGTEDTRDSLAIRIIEMLAQLGARVVTYDPAVRVVQLPPGCRTAQSALEAAQGDALLVLTEWPQFAAIPPAAYASRIAHRLVVDGRNILDPDRVAAAGLRYRGIGRSLMPADAPQQAEMVLEGA